MKLALSVAAHRRGIDPFHRHVFDAVCRNLRLKELEDAIAALRIGKFFGRPLFDIDTAEFNPVRRIVTDGRDVPAKRGAEVYAENLFHNHYTPSSSASRRASIRTSSSA